MVLFFHPGAMPRRRKFKENTHYHIYNRWINKQTLFHTMKDFQRFLWYLDIYKKKCEKDLSILAYCILPNHFHFVVHNITDGHKLSYFIGNICAGYTRYYKVRNWVWKGKRYFESRFKVKEIEDQEYLQQCIHYVENNPLKHGLIDNLEDWLFKSTTTHPGAHIENIEWERDF